MSGRVLVTGGAGFIGSHLAEAYLDAGWEVVLLDNLSSGNEKNVPRGATLVRADIRSPDAKQLLAEGNFDVLNHHAAGRAIGQGWPRALRQQWWGGLW